VLQLQRDQQERERQQSGVRNPGLLPTGLSDAAGVLGGAAGTDGE
jgi:hypothetical protein